MLSLFDSTDDAKYETIPPVECQGRVERRTSFYATWCYLSILVIGVGLGVILGIYVRPTSIQDVRFIESLPGSPIPDDVIYPRTPVVFVPDDRYIGPSHDANRHWAELIGDDAVWLSDPENYKLGKGIKAPWERFAVNNQSASESFYVVSNLHQLHCVNTIRRRYWQLLEGAYSLEDPDAEDWLIHVNHCFEYLRLGITCGDFLILESDSPPNTPAALTVDGLGWGVTHQCINFDRLLAFRRSQEALYNQTLH